MMKRFMSFLLSIVMAAGLCVPALAAEAGGGRDGGGPYIGSGVGGLKDTGETTAEGKAAAGQDELDAAYGKWGAPETDGDGNITIQWEEHAQQTIVPMKGGTWQLDIAKEISNYYNHSGTAVTVDSLPEDFAVDVTVEYHNGTERVTDTKTLTKNDRNDDSGLYLQWEDVFQLPDWQFDFNGTGRTADDFAAYNTIITIAERNYDVAGYDCTVGSIFSTSETNKMEGTTNIVTYMVQQTGNTHTQSKFGICNNYRAPAPVTPPDRPTTEDLNDLRLGVWILCDEQTNHHNWAAYMMGTGYTAGEVTANTGSNKAQYPYTCTVNVTVDMQNRFWMNTNSATAGVKWNAEHQLKPNARTLTATLYHDGTKWTIPQDQVLNPDVALGGESGWNYLKILTIHKPEYTVFPKTGGAGTGAYVAAGVALIAIAGVGAICCAVRKKDDGGDPHGRDA